MKPENFKWTKGSWETLCKYLYYSEYYGRDLETHFCAT